jgi:ATP-dependent Clp protease ATP-binding subunit ClpC
MRLNRQGNVILFIDEMHTIIGAGAAEGAIDASNILKPALARGEIQTIGATTIDEYRKHVEKDPALERRFQPITVDEPTVEDTIEILKGLRDRYEAHHRVKISDEALEAAAKLSYIDISPIGFYRIRPLTLLMKRHLGYVKNPDNSTGTSRNGR